MATGRKRWWVLALGALLLQTAPGPRAAAPTPETWKGEFVWTSGNATGDLEAVFQPAGEGRFEIAFHFEFGGSMHVYRGTAEGSLAGGELRGTVRNDDGKGKRTFRFEGDVADGSFRGTHAETTGGRDQRTGTLTLHP